MSYETLVHELDQMQHDYELAAKEIVQLRQKLDAVRIIIVDVFDKDTKENDTILYYNALVDIEKIVREYTL